VTKLGHCGVLLTNLGTPDAPTPDALRRYLREFLGDRRVVDAPRLTWWLVLNLLVLPFRPRRSARLYQKIWTPEGSPLLAISRRQVSLLEAALAERLGRPLPVSLGMRYGKPSVAEALRSLRERGCTCLVVLPLYPQYSASTTGSTFDVVAAELVTWRRVPGVRFVDGYHNHPGYIAALAASVQEQRPTPGSAERLLISFHGIPERYATAGDPYPEQCAETARLLALKLNLPDSAWRLSFQSRFGREPWLQPYTDATLREWGAQRSSGIDVICPGFSADCLETLEEIAQTGRALFEAAGGGAFRYVAALNDRPDHIAALADIIVEHLA